MNKMIFLAVLVPLLWSANADADRVFDIETYMSMKSISGIRVSPDGEFLAYTESNNDLENDTSLSAVWMQPTWQRVRRMATSWT